MYAPLNHPRTSIERHQRITESYDRIISLIEAERIDEAEKVALHTLASLQRDRSGNGIELTLISFAYTYVLSSKEGANRELVQKTLSHAFNKLRALTPYQLSQNRDICERIFENAFFFEVAYDKSVYDNITPQLITFFPPKLKAFYFLTQIVKAGRNYTIYDLRENLYNQARAKLESTLPSGRVIPDLIDVIDVFRKIAEKRCNKQDLTTRFRQFIEQRTQSLKNLDDLRLSILYSIPIIHVAMVSLSQADDLDPVLELFEQAYRKRKIPSHNGYIYDLLRYGTLWRVLGFKIGRIVARNGDMSQGEHNKILTVIDKLCSKLIRIAEQLALLDPNEDSKFKAHRDICTKIQNLMGRDYRSHHRSLSHILSSTALELIETFSLPANQLHEMFMPIMLDGMEVDNLPLPWDLDELE